MTRVLLSGVIGIAVWMAIPSTPAQAIGRSCPSYSSAVNPYAVRGMRVGGTTCAGGRGLIANWAQNCSAAHCIVGPYNCQARIISRRNQVSWLTCLATGRFVVAFFLGPVNVNATALRAPFDG
jgi:hypothetical protein